MPRNVLPLHLKQTFPPIIGIFTKGEGDGIESRLPFKIFSTLAIFLVVNVPFLNRDEKVDFDWVSVEIDFTFSIEK